LGAAAGSSYDGCRGKEVVPARGLPAILSEVRRASSVDSFGLLLARSFFPGHREWPGRTPRRSRGVGSPWPDALLSGMDGHYRRAGRKGKVRPVSRAVELTARQPCAPPGAEAASGSVRSTAP